MFLKKFDWISPPITLYFKGENSHVSIYSGILSILLILLLLLLLFIMLWNLLTEKAQKPIFSPDM